jgi:hypothetical protein
LDILHGWNSVQGLGHGPLCQNISLNKQWLFRIFAPPLMFLSQ